MALTSHLTSLNMQKWRNIDEAKMTKQSQINDHDNSEKWEKRWEETGEKKNERIGEVPQL